jgi:F-type H+-transporting ATPase subunit b
MRRRAHPAETGSSMPQLAQLPEVFWSQLFWLVVVFGITFFGIGRGMVPRIQSTVDARETRIAQDLERAQAARVEADETEAAWRARMDSARAEAARLANEAKQESARETEARVKAAGDKINTHVEASEAKIRDALNSARAEIETVAAEATREMIQRLTGLAIDGREAAAAVKAELHG